MLSGGVKPRTDKGFGRIAGPLAAGVRRIRLGCAVTRIESTARRITFADGSVRSYDAAITTIPNGCDFDDFEGLEHRQSERFRITTPSAQRNKRAAQMRIASPESRTKKAFQRETSLPSNLLRINVRSFSADLSH